MIKVLQLIHDLSMGGAETLVKEYALGINREIFEVTVLCYNRSGSPYETLLSKSGVRVIYICDEMYFYQRSGLIAKAANKLQRYILLRKYTRKLCPDIIHFHLATSSYVRFAKPKKGTKIFYTQHFDVTHFKRQNMQDVKNIKYLFKHYPVQLIALNRKMQCELNELFHVDNTIVINNGINIEKFKNAKAKDLIRSELGISKDAFVIGNVGRFEKVKNHLFLLDIFREVFQHNENSNLLIVGKGDTRTEIEKKAEQLGVRDRLIILENRNDVPDLMKAMDVFVFPSLAEGLGIVCIEAQMAGIRCIVSDAVPCETKISNLIQYVSLSEPPEYWRDQIVDCRTPCVEYYDIEKWDIKNVMSCLEESYQYAMEKYGIID